MAWFSVRAGGWPRGASSNSSSGGSTSMRTAEDLASELEQQARQAGSNPQQVVDLLERWMAQSDRNSIAEQVACYSLPAGESGSDADNLLALSFKDVLLRSHAFEALLDVCARTPALGAALKRNDAVEDGGGGGSGSRTALSTSVAAVAERLLLPGAHDFWQALLEALLTSAEDSSSLAASGNASAPKKGGGALRWGPWARRMVSILKRGWQTEALPLLLRQLDRRICELASRRQGSGATAAPRPGATAAAVSGGRMCRAGIKSALALERLQSISTEANDLRTRADLLCHICERLEAAKVSKAARVPKLDRLLADARDALMALDAGAQELNKEHETLSNSLDNIGGELQKQITGVLMTEQSFQEKRTALQIEKSELLNRIKEIDAEVSHLEKEAGVCRTQVQQLHEQLRSTTAHFEEKIGETLRRLKQLNGEKLRAVSCQECAHLALDIARSEVRQGDVELEMLRQRHHAELRRTLLAYLREERSRTEAASNSFEAATAAAVAATAAGEQSSNDPTAEAEAAARASWLGADPLVRRAEALGALSAKPPDDAAAGGGVAAGAKDGSDDVAENVADVGGIQAVVASAAGDGVGLCCADCGASGAEWASVTFAVYLCENCAGMHRGLGVHLSFVRSIIMDRWEVAQVRRMRLGGTAKFLEFLDRYPELRKLPPFATQAHHEARYTSRAVAYYKQQLDATCDERSKTSVANMLPPPPSQAEGHLPAAHNTRSGATALAGYSVVGDASSLHSHGGDRTVASGADASESEGEEEDVFRSIREEWELLKVAHSAFQERVEKARAIASS